MAFEEQLKKFMFNPVVDQFVTALVGIVVIWFVIRAVQNRVIPHIKDSDSRYRAKKFGTFTGYFITLVLLAVVFSNKLQGLGVALGVAGAGIAFALQEVITSVAGWLAIMFGGFYKTGDRVQLGGIKGDVMDIGVLRTTIMEIGQWVDGDLYNGRIVLIANSFVFKEPVFNYSGDFPFLWDELTLPVMYGSDYAQAQALLLKAGSEIAGNLSEKSHARWQELQFKYRLEDVQTEPMVTLVANDNWVQFTLRYMVDYKKRRITKSNIFRHILESVDASNGAVKIASGTYQIVGMPDLKVSLDGDALRAAAPTPAPAVAPAKGA